MKKEQVIAVLSTIEEKDFEVLIKGVEDACLEEEKAKSDYRGFDITRGTVAQYRQAEQKWKIAHLQRSLKLTAFFDFFTGKSPHYNGRSFVRRASPEGKLFVNDNNRLCIDAKTEIQRGDIIELLLNGVWVPVKILHDEERGEWYAQDLREITLFGRKARKKVALDKEAVNKKINDKKW